MSIKHSYHQFTFTAAACCGIVKIPFDESECSSILNCIEIRGFKTTFHVMVLWVLIIVWIDEVQLSQQVTVIALKQLNLHIQIFRFYVAMMMHKIKDSKHAAYTHYTWPAQNWSVSPLGGAWKPRLAGDIAKLSIHPPWEAAAHRLVPTSMQQHTCACNNIHIKNRTVLTNFMSRVVILLY